VSEQTPKSLIGKVQSLTTAPPDSALSKWQVMVRVIAISIPVFAALPTAINLYYSWKQGIPFSQVQHRLAQYDLWLKNFECKIDYQAVYTAPGTRLDVGACPKTGDIAIKISGKQDTVAYEWIPFDQLSKPQAPASALLEVLAATAYAVEASKPTPLRVAETGMQVVCQAMQKTNEIVRVVSEGGKCYRELFSPYVGKVTRREEVACNTTCPQTK
jgi:hypothetical protein